MKILFHLIIKNDFFIIHFPLGLKVVLDIGQQEYIQDVGQSAGAVVVVHNSDQMPFPEDEGILALPGRLTNVAMRRVSQCLNMVSQTS